MPRRKNAVPQKKFTVDSENHEIEVEAVRESAAAPPSVEALPPVAPAPAPEPASAPAAVADSPAPTLEIPPPSVPSTITERVVEQAAEQQPVANVQQPVANAQQPAAEQPPPPAQEEKTLLQRIYDWLMT